MRAQRKLLGVATLLAGTTMLTTMTAAAGASIQHLPQYRVVAIPSPDPQANYGSGTASNPNPFASGFGERLRTIGDVDGDGVNDVLISNEPYSPPGGPTAVGRLYIFSGRTQKLLRAIDDPSPQAKARFGFWSEALGKGMFATSADGQSVGAFQNEGEVFVFDGRTGKLVRTIDDPDPQSNADFGGNIIVPGDLNGDGVPDIVATASRAFNGAGIAYAFDGATGQLLYRALNPEPTQASGFGFGAADVGDVNGDKVPDYQVGAPFYNQSGVKNAGRSYIVNGKTGAVLYTLPNPDPTPNARFGQADADGPAPGDITGDGRPDIYVDGFLSNDGSIQNAGLGYLFDGSNGTLIARLHDPTPETGGQFGTAVAQSPGFTKDGLPSLLVGQTPHHDPNSASNVSKVTVFGGRNLDAVVTIFRDPAAQANADFGNSIASLGDVNRDSFPDFYVGARSTDVSGTPNEGIVYAFISQDVTRPSTPTVSGSRRPLPHRVTYRFFSHDADNLARELSFRCSLDSARLHSCSSRVRLTFRSGRHVLRVQAVDPAGNRSRTTSVALTVRGGARTRPTAPTPRRPSPRFVG